MASVSILVFVGSRQCQRHGEAVLQQWRLYIYTSEGNVSDCVHYRVRAPFVDGDLNPDIDGIGKSNVVF